MTVALYSDDKMLEHVNGPRHPERPDRLRSIRRRLEEIARPAFDWRTPSPIDRKWLETVHGPAHVDRILDLRGSSAQLDADTGVSEGSVDAAELAAGGICDAIDDVCTDRADRAFALVRPPGHHAEPDEAMGFCLFNNVAVGAEYARASHDDIDRVWIVDWDVHHGNGTQSAFWSRNDVLFTSSHQYPFYPGSGQLEESGTGEGRGYTVNLPLAAGLGDADYDALYRRVAVPIARAFDPDLVLVSAGFDAHRRDPLAGMNVSAEGFGRLCSRVQRLADDCASGRLVLTLEGGYDLDGLSNSVEACVRVLTGATPPEVDGSLSRAGSDAIADFTDRQTEFWADALTS